MYKHTYEYVCSRIVNWNFWAMMHTGFINVSARLAKSYCDCLTVAGCLRLQKALELRVYWLILKQRKRVGPTKGSPVWHLLLWHWKGLPQVISWSWLSPAGSAGTSPAVLGDGTKSSFVPSGCQCDFGAGIQSPWVVAVKLVVGLTIIVTGPGRHQVVLQ